MDEKKKPADIADPALDREHPDYPGLTARDVREAQAAARKKLEAERKKAASERVEKAELERLRNEEGLVVAGPMGEIVEVVLDMPVVAYGERDTDAWIAINGRRFYRGIKYKLPRAQAMELLFIADRMARNESARLGQDSFAYYQTKRNAQVNNVGGRVTSVQERT